MPKPDSRLGDMSEFGEYFVLKIDDGPVWRPLPELLESATLRKLIAQTRLTMAQMSKCDPTCVPAAAAASSLQISMVARLLSPAIGATLAFGSTPSPSGTDLPRWQLKGHSVEFSYQVIDWHSGTSAHESAIRISDSILNGVITPINTGFLASSSMSHKVLRGNVASAANGAVTVLAMTRPDLEPAGRELVRELLNTPMLKEAGAFTDSGFRRHNCCLFYRVPGGGLCGDCILSPR
ncbi:hypothetical protein AN948_05195 [Rhodococcus sp. ADH]|nr:MULTISPECIES: (2Fe-2S)-binding protein [unclassified Rhodococcus (in: high G+C Gram-positive bacteria)]KPH20757.1 hypothetical protein AN948_05195 [Rhodococcus sp. ADH]